MTSVPTGLPEALVDRIRAMHAGAERGYHGWSHPLALLALHAEVAPALNDPLAVACAILLHDAIYEPRRADNEQRSAELAEAWLKGVVAQTTRARTIRMIQATAAHSIPDDLPAADAADMGAFLDMDLSILGAPQTEFDAYERGVRHEYREVADDAFRSGRAAILEGFLARERLYFSDWGRGRFEAPARANLMRSIEALRSPREA
jgi:predicted metal-dependent HD superfamily phosphohydrolase